MQDSRRARLVLGVLLVVALAMITISYRGGGSSPLNALSNLGSTVFGPVERITGDVTRPAAQLVDGVKGAPAAGAKIAALQRENARLRAELSAAQLGKTEEAQLNRLLSLAGRGGYRIVAANVIAAGPGYENMVTLDAGRIDGVRPDQTVLNGDGLVGRVVSVSADTSTVLLATDASSVVGARMAGTGEVGAVTGTGEGSQRLHLELFDANAALQVGQQLVTFGSVGGSPYVPGVPIGTISALEAPGGGLTTAALVRPFVNFNSLGVVGVVIVPPRTNPRDSVLPPPPAPSASATPGQAAASPSPGRTH